MNAKRYKTAIIGFGKIGAEYADDPVMSKHYPVATHAQALDRHPIFDWCAVVDPRRESLALAQERWGVRTACYSVDDLARQEAIEVAVLATPPDARMDSIEKLTNLKAVIVEKPLGSSLVEATAFMDACRQRNILVQVNYWRRFDATFRKLAKDDMHKFVGQPQVVSGVYGNGLRNNGSHMVDFCRMQFGEVAMAMACGKPVRYRQAPIAGDIDVAFQLLMESGLRVVFQPVDFAEYRENSLDVWGTTGRLQIVQEGLRLLHAVRAPNRAMSEEREIASDSATESATTVGYALAQLYDHMAQMLVNGAPPLSSLESALLTEKIIERIFTSAINFERRSGEPL
jgi:predicted dehydrogenase